MNYNENTFNLELELYYMHPENDEIMEGGEWLYDHTHGLVTDLEMSQLIQVKWCSASQKWSECE